MGNWGYTVTLLIIGFWAHLAPIGYVLCIGRSYIIYPWMLLLRSKLYLPLILVGKGHPDHFAITSAGQTDFFLSFWSFSRGVPVSICILEYIYILCIYVFHYIYIYLHAASPSKMALWIGRLIGLWFFSRTQLDFFGGEAMHEMARLGLESWKFWWRRWVLIWGILPWKTNMEPENRPQEKEIPFEVPIILQVPCVFCWGVVFKE